MAPPVWWSQIVKQQLVVVKHYLAASYIRHMSETENTLEGSSAQRLVREILGYLRRHNLDPGDRLPSERVLAEKMGVGRNALREALVILSTLRVLESRPNSGIYVRRASDESSIETLAMLADIGEIPSTVEIRESIEVRTILELESVKLACERRDDQDLERLEALVRATDTLISKGGNIHLLDTEFHLALAMASHNSVLVRTLNSFYLFSAARRRALFDDLKRGKVSAREHRNLLAAVRERDVEQARAAIGKHISRGRDYWTQVLGDE